MSILRLNGVTREVGTFVILDGVDAAIALGDRVGLVGPNGGGKTTLLRIAAGRDEPDRGEVHRKRGLSLGLLAQEAHFDAAFMAAPDLRTAVRSGAAHLDAMAAELAALEHAGRAGETAYAELQHRFDALGGYTLDQRVDAALSGLGFSRGEWAKPPSAMSGGEQTRASLARLVIADPDLLLLDEPTNHLDIDALEWLEVHLQRRSGSLLVASHDRAFLDATVTRVWELRDRRLTRVPRQLLRLPPPARGARRTRGEGSRHACRADRARARARAALPQPPQVLEDARARGSAREAPGGSTRHPRAGRRLALPGGRSPAMPRAVRARSSSASRRPWSATCRDAARTTSMAGPRSEPTVVARAPFLAAQRGERIGIVGPNGAGKTTLLRTIAGELSPLDGAITFGHNTQLGYLAQLRGSAIPGATVLDALIEAIPVTPGEARGYLARFLFRGDDVFKEVRQLSGGERSRLELALLGIQPSNLLLLDEPTNHLDIAAREAIEGFLVESSATLLIVSHDRRLLETVCDRLWVVGDELAVPFDGGYRAWRAALADGWTTTAAAEAEARRLRVGAAARDRARVPLPPWRFPPGPAAAIDREAGRTAARSASGQAVEGRLPAPEGLGRGGPDPPRPAQEPSRAVARRPVCRRELRGGPPHLERAGGRRAGPRCC